MPAFTMEETERTDRGRLKINLVSFDVLNTQVDTSFIDREAAAIRKKCEGKTDCNFVVTSEMLAAARVLGALPFESTLHYQCIDRKTGTTSSHFQRLTEGTKVTLGYHNQSKRWFKFPWQ